MAETLSIAAVLRASDAAFRDPARADILRELRLEATDETDSELHRLTRFAAELVGAPFAFINLLDDSSQFHKSSTVPEGPGSAGTRTPLSDSLCRYVVLSGQPLLIPDLLEIPELLEHPAVTEFRLRSYAGVPLRLETGEIVGTVCVGDPHPHSWDERTVNLLGNVAADVRAWIEVRRVRDSLLDEGRRREFAEEQARLARLNAEVGFALTRGGESAAVFQHCCEAIVHHLDAAFARIWTLNEAEQVLELRASAGMYTHLDGPHSRVPVGSLKIGLIASERAPRLTNDVLNDPRIGDPAWARREGMVSFAGYPLVVEDRVVGVVALFARHELSFATLDALSAVAHGLALGIERRRGEEELQRSEARKAAIVNSALDCIVIIDAAGRVQEFNPQAEQTFGYTREEAVGREMAELIVPPHLRAAHREGLRRYLETGEGKVIGRRIEITGVHRDGRELPVELAITRVPGTEPPLFTGYLRDITDRKRSERERERLLAREQAARLEAESAEERAHFLAEAGRVLGRSLAPGDIAASLARTSVPFLADWCAVDLLEPDGSLRRAAQSDLYQRTEDFARHLPRLADDATGDVAALLARVAGSGEPFAILEAPGGAGGPGGEPSPIRAAIVLPLRARGIAQGTCTLVLTEPGRGYTPADLALAEELGDRAALTLDNARSHVEVEAARQMLEEQNEELGAQAEELQAQTAELEEIQTEMEVMNEDLQARTHRAEDFQHTAEEALTALKFSETRFRQLAEAIPVQVWTARPDGALDFVTERCARYFGRTPEQVIGDGWTAVVHPDDLPGVADRWMRSLETGEVYEVEFRLRDAAANSYRWHLGRAVALRDEEGRIEHWYGTNTDIHDQKLAEQERDRARADAEEARRAAQEANLAKTRFLNTMSHELRTPLGAIGGYVDLMADGIHGPVTEAQQKCFTRVRHNQRHLLRMVNELLDLAKIESGQLALYPEPVRLGAIVESAEAMIEPQIRAKGQRLDTRLDGIDTTVRVDPERMEQVILNLMSNAMKFTPEGGTVSVIVEQDPGRLYLRVRDDGIGISPDKLETVFEPFHQVESDLTRSQDGTGLGLAISRELVRRMGGEITVESTPGVGSTFTVELPALA